MSNKTIEQKIVEAAKLALEEDAFYFVMAFCKKKKYCDSCPYSFLDARGFSLCIFSISPEHWDKYIERLEEDVKNE